MCVLGAGNQYRPKGIGFARSDGTGRGPSLRFQSVYRAIGVTIVGYRTAYPPPNLIMRDSPAEATVASLVVSGLFVGPAVPTGEPVFAPLVTLSGVRAEAELGKAPITINGLFPD